MFLKSQRISSCWQEPMLGSSRLNISVFKTEPEGHTQS